MNRFPIVALFLLLPFLCQSVEFEFWQVYALNRRISEHWDFTLRTEWRWEEIFSNLFRHQHDIGLQYKPNKWSFHLFYRHKIRDTNSGWKTEPESLLDINRTWEFRQFKIGDRNRFEYRFFDYDWVYRKRFTFIKNIGYFCGDLELYLSNEFFFRNFERYRRNRIAGGFKYFPAEKDTQIRLLFIIQHRNREQEGWVHTKNIIESEIKYRF